MSINVIGGAPRAHNSGDEEPRHKSAPPEISQAGYHKQRHKNRERQQGREQQAVRCGPNVLFGCLHEGEQGQALKQPNARAHPRRGRGADPHQFASPFR
jgi:hypothetical protein